MWNMAQQVNKPKSMNKQCTLFVDLIPFRCGKDLKIIVDTSDDSEDENVKTTKKVKIIDQNKDNICKNKDKIYCQQPIIVDDCLLYPCKACGKLFDDEKYRGMHVGINHRTLDYGFPCLGCGYFFATDRARQEHWNACRN